MPWQNVLKAQAYLVHNIVYENKGSDAPNTVQIWKDSLDLSIPDANKDRETILREAIELWLSQETGERIESFDFKETGLGGYPDL